MNEEIFKRLQDQCWIYHTHPDMIDTDSKGETRPCGFDTKKFAELIVRECFKAAMIESKGHMNPIDLMKHMKERVGVEE